MEKDLTKGSPFKLIIGFAVPMLLGMLFQQFYNLVDTIIVGKTLGVNALAGVGATGALNFMIIGFCMGVCSGFVIPVAQAFGAGKGAELRKYVFNGYVCSIIFSVVLTVAAVAGCRALLTLLRTPLDIFEYSYSYIYRNSNCVSVQYCIRNYKVSGGQQNSCCISCGFITH